MFAPVSALESVLCRELPESVFIIRHQTLSIHGLYTEHDLHGLIVCTDPTTAMLLLTDVPVPGMAVTQVERREARAIVLSKGESVRYFMHFDGSQHGPFVIPVE